MKIDSAVLYTDSRAHVIIKTAPTLRDIASLEVYRVMIKGCGYYATVNPVVIMAHTVFESVLNEE